MTVWDMVHFCEARTAGSLPKGPVRTAHVPVPGTGTCPAVGSVPSPVMADAASLDERLEQIGAQLDWVRDYL